MTYRKLMRIKTWGRRVVVIFLATIFAAQMTHLDAQGEEAEKAPSQEKEGRSAQAGRWSEPVATVNGVPIARGQLAEIAILIHGDELLESLIWQEVVRQEAAKRGIAASQEECTNFLKQEVESQMLMMAEREGLSSVGELEERLRRGGRQPTEVRARIEATIRPFVEPQVLADKMLRQDLKITEEEIQRAFQEEYGEKMHVRQIVLPTRRRAEAVLEKLKDGADFAQLAREESLDPVSRSKGGELLLSAGPGALERAAFALKPGQLSEVVETPNGFHILKCIERVPAKNMRLEDVREKLREELLSKRILAERRAWLMDLVSKANIKRNL